MFAYLSHRSKYLTTAARLRRITAALASAALGVLAWAAAVPAASARMIPADDDYVPARVTAGPTVRVITAGGWPGCGPGIPPPACRQRRVTWSARTRHQPRLDHRHGSGAAPAGPGTHKKRGIKDARN